MKFVNRNGTLHFRKRVPRRFADIEPREYVWISLHTDLEDVAKRKAGGSSWEEMLEAWEAKLKRRQPRITNSGPVAGKASGGDQGATVTCHPSKVL